MDKIEFNVDDQYENEKGVFTVISLHRDEMVIRWESGEEIRTPIELQRNIQKRRMWEKLQKEAEEAAAKNKSSKGQPGFSGFKATDFKVSASKTNWRGRNKLGGAVARKLPDTTFAFNSWAFSTKSELHWQDTDQRKKDKDAIGARFFVRLNPQSLTCGFSVTRQAEQNGPSKDFESFAAWLADEDGDTELHVLAEKDDLAVYNHARPAQEGLRPAKSGWKTGEGKNTVRLDTIIQSIEDSPETTGFQLEVSKKMDKIEAIARGEAIIEDISEQFTRLMALYRAATQ